MDESIVNNFLAEKFGEVAFELKRLAGDASDRSFYRVVFAGAQPRATTSAVLMVLNEPFDDQDMPFLNVRDFMEKTVLPVPALYYKSPGAGLILLEDFGDDTLEDAVRGADRDSIVEIYKRAVDLELELQIEATRAKDDSCVAFHLAFDVDKLMFEFNFFYEHAVLGYKGSSVPPADEKIISDGFLHIARTLAAEPRYLNHRDYHSRNIMVAPGGRLGLVDFQDARLGPLQYDLASLLMDSYVQLPDDIIGELYEYYFSSLVNSYSVKTDRAHFDRIFDYMVAQRNIKAAGSFAFLDCVKKKNRYLKYFAPCLSRVRPAARRHDELAPLLETLAKYVEELR